MFSDVSVELVCVFEVLSPPGGHQQHCSKTGALII